MKDYNEDEWGNGTIEGRGIEMLPDIKDVK